MPLLSPPLMTTVVIIVMSVMTFIVAYIILSGMKGKRFSKKLSIATAVAVIIMLVAFEIGRTRAVASLEIVRIFSILHGILGVASIAAFIIMIKLCCKYSISDTCYIKEHRKLPVITLALWLMSYVMGLGVYLYLYVL